MYQGSKGSRVMYTGVVYYQYPGTYKMMKSVYLVIICKHVVNSDSDRSARLVRMAAVMPFSAALPLPNLRSELAW